MVINLIKILPRVLPQLPFISGGGCTMAGTTPKTSTRERPTGTDTRWQWRDKNDTEMRGGRS